MESVLTDHFAIDMPTLAAFCERWQITELALFGSVLRDDFSPASDIDVLITFAVDHSWSVIDHLRMEQELAELAGRRVEIVSRRALDENANWLTRRTILESARTLYAAA